MRALTTLLFLSITTLLLTGCSSAPSQPANDGHVHAECTVCKFNADLACIDVAVDDKTPRCTYDGKTFFFCSDQCCKKFQKTPTKFAKE